ncbi:GntR family transcriptional regulator [Actinoplanes solisilvae]|uniref:GntR family transcriptional regulator n=1 Tax=Actinoplanes solisilvae TaxID=2486853 RepID=UPI000FD7D0AE|nr:GntR family transcriptional regulator [Actinoplanes solisilvae]
MIEFHLDRRSGVASYLQLVHQVKQALRLGVLQPGDQLPTAREVVAALGINPNTVLKAYRELEREDLVLARPGMGTFIQRTLGAVPSEEQAEIRERLAKVISDGRGAGMGQEDLEALFAAVLKESFRRESA